MRGVGAWSYCATKSYKITHHTGFGCQVRLVPKLLKIGGETGLVSSRQLGCILLVVFAQQLLQLWTLKTYTQRGVGGRHMQASKRTEITQEGGNTGSRIAEGLRE